MKRTLRGINPIILTKEEFDWISSALEVNFEDHDVEWLADHGFYKDDHRGIAAVHFEDRSTIVFDMWSGSSNYWDDWILYDPDESDYWQFDPSFEITDGEIEFYCDDNETTYIINIEVIDNEE